MAKKTSFIKKKEIITTLFFLALGITSFFTEVSGTSFGVPTRSTIGVGVRAFALGNNYVAVADDASAMFWNPAGLAFTPVREFQVALNGFSRQLESDYVDGPFSQTTISDRYRIHLSNASFLRSLPTSRGGCSFALGYQSPYIHDDRYDYVNPIGRFSYSAYGQTNLWTAAFGIQVAQDFGVGVATSFIHGKNKMFYRGKYGMTGNTLDSSYSSEFFQRYYGFDIRFGALYSIKHRAKIGLRVELPQYQYFKEDFHDESVYHDTLLRTYDEKSSGKMIGSFLGAFGISYQFPFLLLSTELHARSPIPDAMENSYYSFWKLGAGVGVEFPFFVKEIVLRGGYKWQEYDKHPMLIDYEIPIEGFNSDISVDIDQHEHTITTGISYLTETGLSFDLSYGFSRWKITSEKVLNETHSFHRISAALAIRY